MSESQEVNKLPYIFTALGTLFLTVGILYFYGYLNFVSEEKGLLVAEFSVVTLGSSEEGQLQAKPADYEAECVDGMLVMHGSHQNGLSGLLVDGRNRAVRCSAQTVPVQ